MKILKGMFSIVMLLMLASIGYAGTIFVANDGSGSYNCDGMDDHIEINQALSNASPADIVHLKAGTYIINNTIWMSTANVAMEGEGDSTIIKVVDGASWPKYQRMLKIRNNSIQIRNIKFDANFYNVGDTTAPYEDSGQDYYDIIDMDSVENIMFSSVTFSASKCDAIIALNVNYMVVKNCTFYDIKHDAIQGYSLGFQNSLIENIIIDSSGLLANTTVAANSGIRPTNSSNNTFRNVTIKACSSAIILEQTMSNNTDNNTFNNITIQNIYQGGIVINGDNIRNNSFSNIVICGSIYTAGGSYPSGLGMKLCGLNGEFRNLSNNTFKNIVINDVYEGILENASTNNIIENSIITNMRSGKGIRSSSGNLVSRYNDVWNNNAGNYDGISPGIGDVSTDPLFADPNNHDFHLKSQYGRWNGTAWVNDDVSSPCIDAGNPSNDYLSEPEPNGKRINVGAYGNTAEASKSALSPIIPQPGTNTGTTPETPNNNAYVYPVPYIKGKHASLTFSNLIPHSKIEIYSADGTLVFEKEVSGISYSFVPKDFRSGVYVYQIKTSKSTDSGKIVIIK